MTVWVNYGPRRNRHSFGILVLSKSWPVWHTHAHTRTHASGVERVRWGFSLSDFPGLREGALFLGVGPFPWQNYQRLPYPWRVSRHSLRIDHHSRGMKCPPPAEAFYVGAQKNLRPRPACTAHKPQRRRTRKLDDRELQEAFARVDGRCWAGPLFCLLLWWSSEEANLLGTANPAGEETNLST